MDSIVAQIIIGFASVITSIGYSFSKFMYLRMNSCKKTQYRKVVADTLREVEARNTASRENLLFFHVAVVPLRAFYRWMLDRP